MIICFSGNGNSADVARCVRSRIHDEGASIVMLREDILLSGKIDVPKDTERVVWVLPVYGWGVPPAVVKCIERMPNDAFESSVPHYLVLTCGDDVGLAHRQWRRLMAAKGWNPVSTFSVQMPNTYMLLPGFDVDPAPLVAEKLQAMPQRVEAICSSILEGRAGLDDVVKGSVPWLKSSIVYPLYKNYDIHPSKFHCDTSRCIGCGRCSRVCPLGNISLNGSKNPVWQKQCTLCLGCYNCCPVNAISYGRRTKGKGQYFNGD